MSRELLKLALEAIERGVKDGYWNKDTVEVSSRIQKALAEQPPQQEPVADFCRECLTYNGHHEGCSHSTISPPQRKPLTDEEIRSIWNDGDCYEEIAFARAIEAAHGIKGQA